MKYIFSILFFIGTICTYTCAHPGFFHFAQIIHPSPVNFEADFIGFFEDYLYSIKAVKEEPDNHKALEIIKDIQVNFTDKAQELSKDLDLYKKDLTKEMQLSFDERLRNHPVIQELFLVLYDPKFLERVENNEALKKGMEQLNTIHRFFDKKEPALVLQEIGYFNLRKGNKIIENHSIFSNLKEEAVAVSGPDKRFLEVQIQGISGSEEVQIYFLIDAEKPKTINWTKDNTRIVLTEKEVERTFIGVPKKGKVTVEQLGGPGGIITGKFSGTVYEEEHKMKKYKLNGKFKVIREGKN